MGVAQDQETLTLRPEIGWAVRERCRQYGHRSRSCCSVLFLAAIPEFRTCALHMGLAQKRQGRPNSTRAGKASLWLTTGRSDPTMGSSQPSLVFIP